MAGEAGGDYSVIFSDESFEFTIGGLRRSLEFSVGGLRLLLIVHLPFLQAEGRFSGNGVEHAVLVVYCRQGLVVLL